MKRKSLKKPPSHTDSVGGGVYTTTMSDNENESPVCLDTRDGGCKGEVEYRIPMSPTGVWYPRCDAHFRKRDKEQERISRTYGTRRYYY